MVSIKYDNQGDAISREVPRAALALIDAGGNLVAGFFFVTARPRDWAEITSP